MLAPAGSEPGWAVTVPAGPEGPTSRGRLAADRLGRSGQPISQHLNGQRPTWAHVNQTDRHAGPGSPNATRGELSDCKQASQ
jgi:hypothetical protein